MVVMCIDKDGHQWHPGHLSGSVSVQPGVGDNLGAEAISSDVAELHGLSWAIMYVAQFCGSYVSEVQYDNKGALVMSDRHQDLVVCFVSCALWISYPSSCGSFVV